MDLCLRKKDIHWEKKLVLEANANIQEDHKK